MAVEDKHPNRTVRKDVRIAPDSIVKASDEDVDNGMNKPPLSISPGIHNNVNDPDAPKKGDRPEGVISEKNPLTTLPKWLGPSQLPSTAAIHPASGKLVAQDERGHIPGLGGNSTIAGRELPETGTKLPGQMTTADEKLAWETRSREEVQKSGDDLVTRQTVASKFHKPDGTGVVGGIEISAAGSRVQLAERNRTPSITPRAPKL